MTQNHSQTKRWVRITQAKDIPLREGRSIQIAGHEIAIFNLGDRFLAVENRCPHRGGPLADGIVSGRSVVCPLHAWKVDLETGRVTNRSEESPCVKNFPAAVQDGVVMLELSVPEDHSVALEAPCVARQIPQISSLSAGD
jgi:nitrite reductase [NAD(P)H], small subunit